MKNLVVCVLGLALLAFGTSNMAQAQSYPAKPIRVIVPYPPADTGDTIARLIGQKLSERLGQEVIVDNRPGASGQIGLELATRAAPDGYTLALGQAGNVSVAPHTYKALPYDPIADFLPVALVAWNYLALVVHPALPYKSVAEMIAWAKANPGKLTFASNGEGGFPHLSFELLRVQAGFTYLHVPYKGSAQIVTDLIGGQVDAAMASYTSMSPLVRAEKLRLLGITNPTRMPAEPGVPTVADSLPRLQFARMVWFSRAAGHAARDRGEAERRDQPGFEASRRGRKNVRRRTGHCHRVTGIFRRNDAQRECEIRKAHQDDRIQAAIVPARTAGGCSRRLL